MAVSARWRRWSWRIPGCLRRRVLDLGWQWLLMVSEKISIRRTREGKGKGRKGKGKGRSGRRFFRPKEKMKAVGHRMNGKGMIMRIRMRAVGPKKMRQRGNPKAGMNGKVMPSMDTSKEKERKDRKGRKVVDHKIKEKDKVMGKAKQIMWTSEFLWLLCDTFTCVPDISQEDREWSARYGAWFFRLCIPGTNPVQKVEEEGVAFHTENQLWRS